jgi:hypothetical protein
MIKDIEITLDALFLVTNLDEYDKAYSESNEQINLPKHKTAIYVTDIVDIKQDSNGFTLITTEEGGKYKTIRVLETINDIQNVINIITQLQGDDDVFEFLNTKIKQLNQKNIKKIGFLEKNT